MRKQFAVVALIVALALPVAAVEGTKTEQVCPDGQQLVSVQAGSLELQNRKPPPPGRYYSDSVSGSGPNYSVRSDEDSASVSGDRVFFSIVCQ